MAHIRLVENFGYGDKLNIHNWNGRKINQQEGYFFCVLCGEHINAPYCWSLRSTRRGNQFHHTHLRCMKKIADDEYATIKNQEYARVVFTEDELRQIKECSEEFADKIEKLIVLSQI